MGYQQLRQNRYIERDFEVEECLVRIEGVVESGRLVNEEGGSQLGLRSLSIWDRSVDNRDKKRGKNVRKRLPEKDSRGIDKQYSTTKWLVVSAGHCVSTEPAKAKMKFKSSCSAMPMSMQSKLNQHKTEQLCVIAFSHKETLTAK